MWILVSVACIVSAVMAGLFVYVAFKVKYFKWRHFAQNESNLRKKVERMLDLERKMVLGLSRSVVESEKELKNSEREANKLRRRIVSLRKSMRHKRKTRFRNRGRDINQNCFKRMQIGSFENAIEKVK